MRTTKRKPGAQPGNLNALKHGYYSNSFTDATRAYLEEALALSPTDLAQEIATLRARLRILIDAQPANLELLHRAMGSLARLAATHYHLQGTDADRLNTALSNVLQSIERTLGAPEE